MAASSSTVCASCGRPLVLTLEDSDDDQPPSSQAFPAPPTVPDDVQLRCGCHFHWQCLLDAYEITNCPHCEKDISNPSPTNPAQQQILCNLHNEGGVQKDLDIFELLTEEAYLKAYPDERKCRAFLEFCKEGDLMAVVGVLQDDSDDDMEVEENTQKREIDILRYQDPIGEGHSGLHAAVAGGSHEVAWLLLLLASKIPLDQLPPQLLQEADAMGFVRDDINEKADIRTLKDSRGRSAEDLAMEIGSPWEQWIGTGRLTL